MIWGLTQPVYSAAALELWVLSKLWYTIGYINNGPKGVRTPPRQKSDLPHSRPSLFFYSRDSLAHGPMELLRSVSCLVSRISNGLC